MVSGTPLLSRSVSLLLLAAAACPAQGIPTRGEIFCAQLNRVIEAVELGGPSALERSRARRPSFGFRHCGAQGPGWFCHQSLAPPELSGRILADQVASCRPELIKAPTQDAGYMRFDGAMVRIRIQESGARGAHVGRIVMFVIEPQAK